jgi:hypothetical protein
MIEIIQKSLYIGIRKVMIFCGKLFITLEHMCRFK